MHAVSTNQIADILHFNDNKRYHVKTQPQFPTSTIIFRNSRSLDFNKIRIQRKKHVPESLFNKVAGLQLALLLKKSPALVFFHEF